MATCRRLALGGISTVSACSNTSDWGWKTFRSGSNPIDIADTERQFERVVNTPRLRHVAGRKGDGHDRLVRHISAIEGHDEGVRRERQKAHGIGRNRSCAIVQQIQSGVKSDGLPSLTQTRQLLLRAVEQS